nr:hypothetical protein [Tanacetum cinerariifolium]
FLRTARALIDVHGEEMILSNSLLEEFADELALISYPPDYDYYRACDIDSDIREIEFLLFQEMFIDEQPPDYSFPSRFDIYPDDFLEIESDATFDDDSFDSEGEKINEDFSRDDVLFSPDNEDKVKEYSKKDKIGSKPDKNGKRGEAGKSQKQSQ